MYSEHPRLAARLEQLNRAQTRSERLERFGPPVIAFMGGLAAIFAIVVLVYFADVVLPAMAANGPLY